MIMVSLHSEMLLRRDYYEPKATRKTQVQMTIKSQNICGTHCISMGSVSLTPISAKRERSE